MTVHQQFIANQGFLKRGRHESVTAAGVSEDGEVDPEEDQVEDQRDDDEANNPSEEMFGNTFLSYAFEKAAVCEELRTYIIRFPPVQKVPKVNYDSNTDSHDGKDTVDLGRPGAGHEYASSKHPSPPIEREFAIKSSECFLSRKIPRVLTGSDICGI